jgi:hypothetical protein
MKKYLVSFCLVLLISIFVTCQKEKHAHDALTAAANRGVGAVTSGDRVQPAGDGKETQGYSPNWYAVVGYRVFSWPEGITVWALFLTLMVIAEQTGEVANAAKATHEQAKLMKQQIDLAINKDRARIFVHRVLIDHSFLLEGHEREPDRMAGLDPKIDKFHIAISNQGESKAYDVSCLCAVTVIDASGRDLARQQSEESVGMMEPNKTPIVHGVEFWPCLSEAAVEAIRN